MTTSTGTAIDVDDLTNVYGDVDAVRGQPVRPLVTGAMPPSATDLPRRVAEFVAAPFDTVVAAAEDCDVLVATRVMPAGVWR